MMDKQRFEDVICKYPELIEEGLIFKSRQIPIIGKFVLLFEDSNWRSMVAFVETSNLTEEHINKMINENGQSFTFQNSKIRVVLVGTQIPSSLRPTIEKAGLEWREIKIPRLVSFLKEIEDQELLKYFLELNDQIESNKKEAVIGKIRGTSHTYPDGLESLEIWINKAEAITLPYEEEVRVDIKLNVKEQKYSAGLRSTKNNDYVWISPNLIAINLLSV